MNEVYTDEATKDLAMQMNTTLSEKGCMCLAKLLRSLSPTTLSHEFVHKSWEQMAQQVAPSS